MKTKRAALALITAFLLCIAVCPPLVYLHPQTVSVRAAAVSSEIAALEDKLAKASKQRDEAQKALDEAKNERSDALKTKKAMDAKILALNAELDALTQLIDSYETQIHEKDAEIAEETARLESLYKIVRERMRINREDGGIDLITILIDSNGLSEFFKQMDRFMCMIEYDGKLMDEYSNGIKKLSQSKDELISSKAALEANKYELELRRKEFADILAEAEKTVSDAEKDIKTAESTIAKIEAEEKKYNEEREKKLAELQKASNQAYVGGVLMWPLPQKYTTVSCGFGPRIHPVTGKAQFHLGIDIPAPYGTEIYAVNDGTVVEVSYNYADGYYVTISHGGGIASFYSHLSKYLVKVGDKVTRGQVIAYVGTSGYVTGAHLNLNIYENNTAVNPMSYFGQ
jgi:murein DD-endopeptidase MepM/ murein hydrolase activator NlpD